MAEPDSRTLQTKLKCPYCKRLLDRMENPQDFVEATTMDKCNHCGQSFYLILRWVGFTVEEMRAGNAYYQKETSAT